MPDPRGPREDGFTLVELLVVLVIMALLFAIAVPTFQAQKSVANQKAMIAASELVAGGLGRHEADFPPINGTDPLMRSADANRLRARVCSAGNPTCLSTDRGLFTRSGMPAIREWPHSPYGGNVALVRGSCTVRSAPGTVRVCRLGRDGFRVVGWGRNKDGNPFVVYDKSFR